MSLAYGFKLQKIVIGNLTVEDRDNLRLQRGNIELIYHIGRSKIPYVSNLN